MNFFRNVGIIVGTGIASINICNYRKSNYFIDNPDSRNKLVCFSIVKGIIHGVLWPVTVLSLVYSIENNNYYKYFYPLTRKNEMIS